MVHQLRFRKLAMVGALVALLAVIPAGSSRGDLASQYAAGQQRAGQLQSEIQADNTKIQGFEGTISSLQTRLNAVEQDVSIQTQLLDAVESQGASARAQLTRLEALYAHDRQVLAAQLVADYESPPPTVVSVIVNAHGFEDLLSKLSDLTTIARKNAGEVTHVEQTRLAVAAQARRLAAVQARQQRATAAVLVGRDQVAQLRLSIVDRELVYAHAKAQKTAELTSLQKTLSHEASELDQRAAAAQAASSGTGSPPPGGCINTPFVAHGGSYGFFPAAGTDYTVNQEPVIAARLDALGKALQLQLIGLSGYRTPEHSVEVGGFADDPHTRGEASDTPGVEGVPEATLEEFCLTRPFPGPREADHIQEM
jgi:peptidoglycan hydrolase CwlO-like protein